MISSLIPNPPPCSPYQLCAPAIQFTIETSVNLEEAERILAIQGNSRQFRASPIERKAGRATSFQDFKALPSFLNPTMLNINPYKSIHEDYGTEGVSSILTTGMENVIQSDKFVKVNFGCGGGGVCY